MKNDADIGWSYSSFHTLPHQIIFLIRICEQAVRRPQEEIIRPDR